MRIPIRIHENLKILTEKNLQGAPDLLIEILSSYTTDNDRIYKKMVYQKFGVKEYWIVSPDEGTIELWTLKDKKFRLASNKAKQDQTIESQILEGFEINLSLIFKF